MQLKRPNKIGQEFIMQHGHVSQASTETIASLQPPFFVAEATSLIRSLAH